MSVFPHIEYLDWMAGRPSTALHDLGSTGLGSDRTDEGPVPPAVADAPDPPAGVTLHALLATEYGVHPEQVVVTAGASHARLLAFATAVTLAAEDGASDPRVLVESPGYEPHVRTPAALGADVDRFRRDPAEAYRLDPGRVRSALDPDAALVAVTDRHNPSGRLADRAALDGAAAAAREAGARLLVDEVYAPYVLEAPSGPAAFGGPTAAGTEGAIAVNSLSEFFGLPELRVGWLVADEEFAARARAVKRHVPGVAGVSAQFAARAVHGAGDLAARRRERLAANADLLAEYVASRDAVSGTVHDGCSFAFLSAAGVGGDDLAAAAWEEGLLVVPGRFFGDGDRVRVSLGGSPEDCEVALRRLDSVRATLRE